MRIIIIQTAFIGDVILSTALVDSLFQAGHTVGFVAKPEAAPLLEYDKRISALFVYDKHGIDSGIGGLYTTSKKIRESTFDVAVIPHRSLRSALLGWLAGIPRRIGFSTSAGKWFLTDRVVYEKYCHEIIRNHLLLAPFGVTDKPAVPVIHTTEADKETARLFFESNTISEKHGLIGFGAGSKWFTKQWGISRYSELAKLIIRRTDYRIICFGGKEEQELGETIKKVSPARIVVSALSLRESAEALKRVSVVISNDNGLMHLAAAVGVPVIALFGPTIAEFGFAPVGKHHTVLGIDLYCRPCSIHGMSHCPERHFRCMAEIIPEKVFEIIMKYIVKPPDEHLLYKDDL